MKRKDHQAAVRVQQRRLKPAPVTFEDLRCYAWMNDGRLEECGLELEHARDFNIAKALAVTRTARRHYRATPILVSLTYIVLVASRVCTLLRSVSLSPSRCQNVWRGPGGWCLSPHRDRPPGE